MRADRNVLSVTATCNSVLDGGCLDTPSGWECQQICDPVIEVGCDGNVCVIRPAECVREDVAVMITDTSVCEADGHPPTELIRVA